MTACVINVIHVLIIGCRHTQKWQKLLIPVRKRLIIIFLIFFSALRWNGREERKDSTAACTSELALGNQDHHKSKPAAPLLANADSLLNSEESLMLREIYQAIVVKNKSKSSEAVPSTSSKISITDPITNQLNMLKEARSVSEFPSVGFTYNEEQGVFQCVTCTGDKPYDADRYKQPGYFLYDPQLGLDFSTCDILPNKFRSCKGRIKDHIDFRSRGTSQNDH